jgi:uroporphyrinogen-III decarboxylase
MTPKERLMATLNGVQTDRVPIYTQIPFAVDKDGFKPGAFHGYDDYDNWRECDPEYWKLVRRMEEECDNFFIWRPKCMSSDQFFFPPSMISSLPPIENDGRIETVYQMKYGKILMSQKKGVQPGTGHTWQMEHYCKTADDARILLEIPWQGEPVEADKLALISQYLGEKGVVWITIPSPLLVVCRLFDPMQFLILTATEKDLIDRLMRTAFERIYGNLVKLLELGVGPIIRFGGAEHATPPMMSPHDFDWLIVNYDKPLMDLCKRYGCKIAVHCHGNIRHALKRFVEMGVDQTDPVETVPNGEITLAEARKITKEQITLTGNIQMKELYNSDESYIEDRVREILKEAGSTRFIVTSTGTPLEKISPRLARNYHCMIDSVLKYGKH